jgi:hypothetical protein
MLGLFAKFSLAKFRKIYLKHFSEGSFLGVAHKDFASRAFKNMLKAAIFSKNPSLIYFWTYTRQNIIYFKLRRFCHLRFGITLTQVGEGGEG